MLPIIVKTLVKETKKMKKKINIEKKTISGIHLQTKERDEGDKLLNYTKNHAIECKIYHDIESIK